MPVNPEQFAQQQAEQARLFRQMQERDRGIVSKQTTNVEVEPKKGGRVPYKKYGPEEKRLSNKELKKSGYRRPYSK